jgi:hypothetical protein
MQQVTLWSRMNENKEYEFNHLEMGHVAEGVRFPTPKHENHKKPGRGVNGNSNSLSSPTICLPRSSRTKQPVRMRNHPEGTPLL